MARKTYIPLEIDFLFGLDGKGFTTLTMTERMTFIYLWSHLWHSGQEPEMTFKQAQDVLKMGLASVKHLDKYLTNIRQKSLIEYDGKRIKFLGLKKKRQNTLKKNGTETVQKEYKQSVPNEYEYEDRNKKENKNEDRKEKENEKTLSSQEDFTTNHLFKEQDIAPPVLDMAMAKPEHMKTPAWRLALEFMQDVSPSFLRTQKGRDSCHQHFTDLLAVADESEISGEIKKALKGCAAWDIKIKPKQQKEESIAESAARYRKEMEDVNERIRLDKLGK